MPGSRLSQALLLEGIGSVHQPQLTHSLCWPNTLPAPDTEIPFKITAFQVVPPHLPGVPDRPPEQLAVGGTHQ